MTLQLPVIRVNLASTSKHDRQTGIRCPRCCRREIVYNGNYFCSGMGEFGLGPDRECSWALPHTDDAEHEFTEPHHVELQRALVESMMVSRNHAT